jgi:hypothetical protein
VANGSLGRHLPWWIVLAALVSTFLVGTSRSLVAAQPSPPEGSAGSAAAEVLGIESVTPWVEPSGTFNVRFAPSTGVPPDSLLRVTIHQPLRVGKGESLADLIDASSAEDWDGSVLQGPMEFPVASLGDPAQGLVLDLPIRSGTGPDTRLLIPTAGIHPVSIELQTPDGQALWSDMLFLNRLPSSMPVGADGQPAVVAVQLVLSIDSSAALDPSGATDLDANELAMVGSMQELLGELGDLPLTVALRPNTIEGLRLSGEPGDTRFLETASGSNWTFTRQSYVRVDATGLTETGGGELPRQVSIGDAVTAGSLKQSAASTAWVLDDTVDPASAAKLRDLGVNHLMMSADRFTVDGSSEPATARVFRLDQPEGVDVSSFDSDWTRELMDATTDPALVVNRLTTRLMAEWFGAVDSEDTPFPGVVASIVVPPGTSAETLRDLAELLSGSGPLQLRPFPQPATSDGHPLRARLLPRQSADYSGVVSRTSAVGARVDGYRSMTAAADPVAVTWDLVNDQAPALFVDDSARQRMWTGVDAQIDARLAKLEPPPSRTVVLTGRSGTIPLRFRNGLDVDVRLRMRTRSARLDFPAGEVTEIVLKPGENWIDLPVVVQAPGSSLMRIELSSPDGGLRLPDTSVTVRSSSISGVGAALSVISLLFLAGWWIRTHRRRSRQASTGEP